VSSLGSTTRAAGEAGAAPAPPAEAPYNYLNQRDRKPRSRGLMEIRGPYYTPMGKRYLDD